MMASWSFCDQRPKKPYPESLVWFAVPENPRAAQWQPKVLQIEMAGVDPLSRYR